MSKPSSKHSKADALNSSGKSLWTLVISLAEIFWLLVFLFNKKKVKVIRAIAKELNIPIIASGGAGTEEHFKETFTVGKADAALAASVFHFGKISIPSLKNKLKRQNIAVRI